MKSQNIHLNTERNLVAKTFPELDKKVCLVSLGCPKNLVDAEMMLGSLVKAGYQLTIDPQEAQVIVVNTCSFIDGSKSESIDQLLEMSEYKKSGNCQVLVSTGCLSQRYGDALKTQMSEVDLIIGTGEFDRLPHLLDEKLNSKLGKSSEIERKYVSDRQILPDPDLPRILSTPNHYSYLKVSEGCSHRCSFCIIPKIRGGLKSSPLSQVLAEAENLLNRGVKELNLIAQDLNEYGRDLKDGSSLVRLIEGLDQLSGDFWIRPLYMYPLLFNEDLISALKNCEHFTRYIDMPLQHISENIMLSMKRGSPGRYVRQLLDQLRKSMPDLSIRTTFIVGYPGETEENFEELCQFIRDYPFDHLGVFAYSQEENTPAAEFGDQVPDVLREERRQRLMEIQQEISRQRQKSLLGKEIRVLVEGPSEENDWVMTGRASFQAPEIDGVTYLSEIDAEPGTFIHAEVIETHDYDLVAKALD